MDGQVEEVSAEEDAEAWRSMERRYTDLPPQARMRFDAFVTSRVAEDAALSGPAGSSRRRRLVFPSFFSFPLRARMGATPPTPPHPHLYYAYGLRDQRVYGPTAYACLMNLNAPTNLPPTPTSAGTCTPSTFIICMMINTKQIPPHLGAAPSVLLELRSHRSRRLLPGSCAFSALIGPGAAFSALMSACLRSTPLHQPHWSGFSDQFGR